MLPIVNGSIFKLCATNRPSAVCPSYSNMPLHRPWRRNTARPPTSSVRVACSFTLKSNLGTSGMRLGGEAGSDAMVHLQGAAHG